MNRLSSKRIALAALAVAIGLGSSLASSSSALAESNVSDGIYQVPYEVGTKVKITNDHLSHNPSMRIDMIGIEGKRPYRVVAAADGKIRFIVDKFSKRQDSGPCNNNYVWIEHANGEWTKYSHLQKNSVTKAAGLSVGTFVKAGTFLGYQGNVGCASGPHLHFEVGVPNVSDPIISQGGYLKDNANSKRNRIPKICGIPNGQFADGQTYVATKLPRVSLGAKEVARHGVPAQMYQCVFDRITQAGYQLTWIDGFNINGKVYFNAVFRPANGVKWAAFHGLTSAQYQAKFDQYTGAGFRPTQVESYRRGNGIRYAVIFAKQKGPAFKAYHGRSAGQHQQLFDQLTQQGWRPRNISVVSVNGQRSYTALYEKTNIGSFMAKSFMTPSQYQEAFNENKQAGRQVAYLNAYLHNGKPRFTAIWNSLTNGSFKARHGMSSGQYQQAWETTSQQGFLTSIVTGYEQGNSSRYAAVWNK